MTRFFIGQRVRIVRTFHNPKYLGCEARIVDSALFYDWTVLLPDGSKWATKCEQLEPIQPEGMKPVEWSECLWQPNEVAA